LESVKKLLIKIKRSKLKEIWNVLNRFLYGSFNGVKASQAANYEQLIFSEEKFRMPELKDIFGDNHKNFNEYGVTIPPFYVRVFNNAYCFTDREEVFTSSKEVITEYTAQKINPFIGKSKKILYTRNYKKINARVAHLSLSGLEANYAHFLLECMARYYLLEKSIFKPDYYIISNHLPFQAQMLDLLGISSTQVISTNIERLIQAKELIVPSFINNWEYLEMRGYKINQKQWIPYWIADLYKGKIIPKVKITRKKKIFISRSLAKYRKIDNEKEVQSLFVKYGFEVYNDVLMSVKDIAELFANSSIVAGTIGAGLANMIFASPNTIIFEIFPQYFHDSVFRILANVLGFKYYYMIGETKDTTNVHPQHENAYINIEKLEKAIKKILDSL